MSALSIRRARKGDEKLILELLHELAVYEKLEDKFHIDEQVIRRDYLCSAPFIVCDLAFADGEPMGIATWYWTYMSFAATRALYLEDLYVRPDFRGRGFGKALLAHLAKTALDAGASKVDWQVLPWNTPSIDFYEGIGAQRLVDWYVYSLSGAALEKLGRE